MIKLDAIINDKKLLASIQKGVDTFNRSTAGKAKLNLKINEKGFRQPLGRITGDLDKFESALAASNARVIAFGASTAVIGGMTKAFKELASTTINVQKQFADINRILNVSNKEFEKFSGSLFDIGKKTATTFDDAAKAALEFARQGLGMNETLKRTADALTLVRLTGVNAEKAVSSLTATVNAFQQSSLTTTEALNKFVAVETKFAVSAKDLMEGLGRVGSAAVDAKVDFDELNAMIAAVQQQTGRGGAVIGNALKTIFTRLQRRDTLTALEQFNVEVQDMEGNILPAMNILQNFAKTYKTLSDANKGYLREQVAGVFQANILSAIVKDINSDFQVYNRALKTSTEATNEAANANARLNQTISALLSQTGTELIRLQENIGKVTFEPIARAILGPFKDIVSNINALLDGEGIGSDFASGLLKGIRNIVAGPGLVAAIAVIGKIFITTVGYITKAIPTLIGITTETQKQANLQATIEALLQSDAGLSKLIAQNEGNAAKQAGILAGHAKAQEKAFKASVTSTGLIASNLRMAGMTTNKSGAIVPGRRGARGYVPGFAGEAADVRKGVGGVSSSARPVHIPNFAFGGGQRGSMVANTGEYMVPNFRGGGSAVFNPAMVRANGGLPQGAKRITAAQGYVPNFKMTTPGQYLQQPGATLGGLRRGVQSGNISSTDMQKNWGGVAAKYGKTGEQRVNQMTTKAAAMRTTGKPKAMQFSMPAKDIKIGAIVGMKSGGKTGYNPSSGFGVIGKEGKIANKGLAQLVRSPAYQGAKFKIKNIPVGAINTIGKGTEKKSAEDVLKEKFTSQMNDIMVPALGKYSSSIFSELFKDDGQTFAQTLTNTRGKRVFSTSVEGGIMESALQFAGQQGSKFGGDDSARWDFEESGKISKPLLDTFFKGKTTQVDRADAKRSDSAPNIKSLIGKSFGTALTANRIARYGPVATAIKGLTAKKAAGGYIPNFAGRGMMTARAPKGTIAARNAGNLQVATKSGLTALVKGIDYKIVGGKARFTAVGEQKTFGADLEKGGTSLMLADGRMVLSNKPLHGMAAMQAKIPANKIESLVVGGGFHNVNTGKLTFRESDFVNSNRLQQVVAGASGYIPNFAGGGLGAAIGREKAAGVPSSAIRINSSPRFQSAGNPAGLAVTNKMDEPRGLRDVPNFADLGTDIVERAGGQAALLGIPGLDKRGKWAASFNKVLAGAAQDWADNRTTTKEFTKVVGKLSNQYGVTGEAQKKVLKNTLALGKQLRPGGGMAGMMAMMMIPMAGGMIEQGVGGQAGSAISGGLTGGVTGGWLGSMAGGALATKFGAAGGMVGGLPGAAIGAGVGALVGATAGIITSLDATADSAASVTAELQALAGGLKSNATAAIQFIQAQKDLAVAATEDELAAAANRATIALESISDTDLAESFAEAGTNVKTLTDNLELWSGKQGIKIKMKAAQAALLSPAGQTTEDEIERLEAVGDQKAIDRKMKGFSRPLAKLLMDPALFGRTGKDARGAEPQEVTDFFKEAASIRSEYNPLDFTGQFSEADFRGLLTKHFGEKGMTGEMIGEMAHVLESLDPGWTIYQAEDQFKKHFDQGFFAEFYGEMFGAQTSGLKESTKTQLQGANYTRDFEALLKSINTSVLTYTEDLAIISHEAAVRNAALTARKGFLGFRGRAANLGEARGVSAANFAGKRQAVDRNVFNQNQASIISNLKSVFKTPAGVRGGFQDVFFGQGGFTQRGAAGGIAKLKEARALAAGAPGTGLGAIAPDAVAGMTTLITKLEAAYKEQMSAILKDEKVQELKFKAEELRARITTEQFRLAVLESKNIHAENMNMSKARGEFDLYKMRQERSVQSPEAMFGLTPMQQVLKKQGASTNIFNKGRELEQKDRLSDARQKFIETKTQVDLNTTTGKLVDANIKLRDAVNALNSTLNGTPTAPTGISPASSHKGPAFQDPLTKADIGIRMGPIESIAKGVSNAVSDFFGGDPELRTQKFALKDKESQLANLQKNRYQLSPEDKKDIQLNYDTAGDVFNKFETMTPAQRKTGAERMVAQPLLTPQFQKDRVSQWLKDNARVKRLEEEVSTLKAAISGPRVAQKTTAAAPTTLAERDALQTDLEASFKNATNRRGAPLLDQTDTTGYHPLLSAQVGAGFNVENYKLTSDELKFINQQTQEINQAVMAGNVEGAKTLALQRQSAAEVFTLAKETDNAADSAKELREHWERIDAAQSTKFSAGLRKGFDDVAQQSHFIYRELGEKLPVQFRDNMVGAIGAAMDKTSSLGDALDGVALAFLSTMRQAFLQSAVSSMMGAGKTLWSGNQRGGFIAAQNGTFVGGNSTGDRHPALLESGEYVLNRNAVGALGGPDALNSINFGAAPRFQKGGGHLMKLAEKIPSSRFSGLFLQNSNPEYDEYADAAVEKQQKAMAKHQKKEQKKAMILSTIISGVMAAGMGALSKGASKWNTTSKWGSNRVGDPAGWSTMNKVFGQKPEFPGSQRGGFIGRQAGGSIGGAVARRYGLFQGGGTVPVSSGAPSLGGSTNTNNISINIGLGGDNESPGSGASQTATGNTGAPSKANTADAKALSEKIKSQVLKILTEEQRVGGTLSPSARRP